MNVSFRARQLWSLLVAVVALAAGARADTTIALKDGESLTYKVSWAVLPGAGEIKVTAQADNSGSEPRLKVTTTTSTKGLARLLLKFDAEAESVFDAKTGRLLSMSETSRQNDKRSTHGVTFDYAKKEALYQRKGGEPEEPARALPMPAGEPMDLITQLLQTRSWDLKPGEMRDALVLFDDDFYELTIHAARTEQVRTGMGTFNTMVLEPRMDKTEPKGMFKKGAGVRVWISQDDGRRLPVKFEVEFKIGTGVATLTQYQGPAGPQSAAQVEKTDAKK